MECVSNRELTYARGFSKESFLFKVGDKVKIVDKKRCQYLDELFYNKRDHSIFADMEVTISNVLYDNPTFEQAYQIEESDDRMYFEQSYFVTE